MRSLVSTAHDDIRTELRRTTGIQLVARCSKFRSTGRTDPASVTKIALRSLARRINDSPTRSLSSTQSSNRSCTTPTHYPVNTSLDIPRSISRRIVIWSTHLAFVFTGQRD